MRTELRLRRGLLALIMLGVTGLAPWSAVMSLQAASATASNGVVTVTATGNGVLGVQSVNSWGFDVLVSDESADTNVKLEALIGRLVTPESKTPILLTDDLPYEVEVDSLNPEELTTGMVRRVGVEVEITRVPDFLFASAKNWTPIEFNISAGDFQVTKDMFTELKATLHYHDHQGNRRSKLISNLENYIAEIGDKVFECYISPANYADITIYGNHYSANAYFVLSGSVRLDGHNMSFESEESEGGRISKRFVDRHIYAIDIREDSGHFQITRAAHPEAFVRVKPTRRFESVKFHRDWNVLRLSPPWAAFESPYLSNASTSCAQGLPRWYWPAVPKWNRSWIDGRTVLDPNPYGFVYQFEVALLDSASNWNPVMKSEAYTEQRKSNKKSAPTGDQFGAMNLHLSDNDFLARYVGLRNGVYFFISYGGKAVPDVLPANALAMDLSIDRAYSEIVWCRVVAETRIQVDRPSNHGNALVGLTLNIGSLLTGGTTEKETEHDSALYGALSEDNASAKADKAKDDARVDAYSMISRFEKSTSSWTDGHDRMIRIAHVRSYTGGATESKNDINVRHAWSPEGVGTMLSVFVELNTAVQQESVRRPTFFSHDGRKARATAIARPNGQNTMEIKLWKSN